MPVLGAVELLGLASIHLLGHPRAVVGGVKYLPARVTRGRLEMEGRRLGHGGDKAALVLGRRRAHVVGLLCVFTLSSTSSAETPDSVMARRHTRNHNLYACNSTPHRRVYAPGVRLSPMGSRPPSTSLCIAIATCCPMLVLSKRGTSCKRARRRRS